MQSHQSHSHMQHPHLQQPLMQQPHTPSQSHVATMQDYVRLSDAASPTGGNRNVYFPYNSDSDVDDQAPPQSQSFWQRLTARRPPAPPPQSGYLTLVPLSDSRLKPRHTKLMVSFLLLLTVGSVCGVYLLVPRGVSVGTIEVHSSQISFNTSKSTYMILLTATMPIYNPNYLAVRISGTVNVSFYDQQAGYTTIEPVFIQARAQPQVISVDMDASSVPQKYLFTIYTQCFTFPEKLIFFLTGNLSAEYLGKPYMLPPINNYFIISCASGGGKKARGGSDQQQQQLGEGEGEGGEGGGGPRLLPSGGGAPAAPQDVKAEAVSESVAAAEAAEARR